MAITKRSFRKKALQLAGALLTIASFAGAAFAHCDTMDGPVVKAARAALRSGNINRVLIWVHESEEAEVITAFKKVLKVRRFGRDARELADSYFFETVVRLHRAGEGEPFTGLKPSGGKDNALFNEIDEAIERNSMASITSKFPVDARDEIEDRFRDVIARKNFKANDVAAGRDFVASYVAFLHLVEKLEGHEEG